MSADLFVPAKLIHAARAWSGAEGEEWLARLPVRLAELELRWSIEIGRAFSPGGATSFAAPVTLRDGSPAVLKVTIPHREARHEAAALRLYDGVGAVRVMAEDAELGALLLERCEPGTPLSLLPSEEEVIEVAARLLRRLWRRVPGNHPFELLSDVAAEWAELVEERFERFGRPFETSLLERAAELLRALSTTARDEVLLHQDFHPGNVLAARREPWLAIDPKPLAGDPAFDPVQLLLQPGDVLADADPHRLLARRLARLADALGEDSGRICDWGLARSVEWALWHLEVGAPADARRATAIARLLADLSDRL